VKPANLHCGDRALGDNVTTSQGRRPCTTRDRIKINNPPSKPWGAVAPIPDGIAMLIDILAHDALKTVMAEREELRSVVTRDKRLMSHTTSPGSSPAKSEEARLNRSKAGHSKIAGV
jgi:hypothetical protein